MNHGPEPNRPDDDFHLSAAALPPRDGDERDRTADLLNAIQALSQLSYAPGRESLRKTGAAPLWSRAQEGRQEPRSLVRCMSVVKQSPTPRTGALPYMTYLAWLPGNAAAQIVLPPAVFRDAR